MSKTYLVTGGAGFIGSHLVDLLLEKNYTVRVIDNLSTGRIENLVHQNGNPKLSLFEKDICDPDLAHIFNEVDVVFHLAAIPRVQRSFKQPIETNFVNVTGTLNVLENSRKAGVQRIVFASSSSVYGQADKIPFEESDSLNPVSPYALQKLIGEKYVKFYEQIHKMETVCLRYFNVYGPRQNPHEGYASLIPKTIDLIANNESPVIYGDGSHRRDFTFVKDVVKATLLAGISNETEIHGSSINIGYGQNNSVNSVVSELSKNTSISTKYLPPLLEPRETEANISQARKLLKWSPETDISCGLGKTIAWYQNEKQLLKKVEN